MKRFILAAVLLWGASSATAQEMNYGIKPVDLGKGCYAVMGGKDYFNFKNGGFIVNTGFIVTDDGVVVIDTGPSKRFGEQLRAEISEVTDQPVRTVIITHIHPDHFLGSQAFRDIHQEGGTRTQKEIAALGQDFTLNMYRLAGDWMRGTEPMAPSATLTEGIRQIGGHRIKVTRFEGHSHEDFVVTDETCGVMYAADLLFYNRTPTTPHADLDRWLTALNALDLTGVKTIVPGHGDLDTELMSPGQTKAYVSWLKDILHKAATSGLDLTEVMELPIPSALAHLSQAREEFQRSAANLYPAIEDNYLPKAAR